MTHQVLRHDARRGSRDRGGARRGCRGLRPVAGQPARSWRAIDCRRSCGRCRQRCLAGRRLRRSRRRRGRIRDRTAAFGVLQLHGWRAAELGMPDCRLWIAASLGRRRISPASRTASRSCWTRTIRSVTAARDARSTGTGRATSRRRGGCCLPAGCTPGNVGEAIRDVRPYGVDVASGIEDRPGVKNAQAMRAFVAAVARGGSMTKLKR